MVLRAVLLKSLRSKLRVEEIDEPKLSSNEVLVKISVTGVCYRDLLTVEGYFPRVKIPLVLGHEIAGKIVKVGENVSSFKVGDRVVSLIFAPCGTCYDCTSGNENICRNKINYGEDVDGSYAELVKVKQTGLVKVPEGVTDEGATISACVTGMLVHALKRRASIKEDEVVLVTGAGGGVGIHAVQVAKAYGAKVIAVTSSDWKVETINEVGADHVVVSSNGFSDKVRKLAKEGVDIVIEAVGQPTFNESLRCVKWGGRMVVVGNVNPVPVSLSLGYIILRENSLLGSLSSTKRDVAEALDLTAQGKIVPVIYKTMPLDMAQEAHELLRKRLVIGRVMLRPSP